MNRWTWMTCGLLVASAGQAQTDVSLGRYTRMTNAGQAPMDTPVLRAFESDTVGGAIHEVLAATGYTLAEGDVTHPKQAILTASPLPHAHRDLRAHRSIDALVVLAGPAFRVMVDHVHRLVGFEVRPPYRRPPSVDVGPLSPGETP